jgi:hypothetical protein
VHGHRAPSPTRLRRLWEELCESGLELDDEAELTELLLTEVDHALRPTPFERRLPSTGTIIEPTADATGWSAGTDLEVTRRPLGDSPLSSARRFADGLSSWLIRRVDGDDEWAVFDRPAGSERDLVVLADALGGVVVQRHPVGVVRIVGPFGVLRSVGIGWHHEPPIADWFDILAACRLHGDRDTLERLLTFAVHDLGARGTGAILVYRPDGAPGPAVELRLPTPPALRIADPAHLAPLRHALSQIDGAAFFDDGGVLRELGARLVPTADAESAVAGLGGMRHTSGRRYSYDDPFATVIVVSEDGPVTVLRSGQVVGSSSAKATQWEEAP